MNILISTIEKLFYIFKLPSAWTISSVSLTDNSRSNINISLLILYI